MRARLLVAVSSVHEATFVSTLGASREVSVARRCADVADLLAAADAGLGTHAVVSADLPRLELDTIDRLRRLGLSVLGVVAPGDEPGERRLRQLGIRSLVAVDADVAGIEAAVAAAGSASTASDSGAALEPDPAAPRPPGRDDPDARLDARLAAALDGDLAALREPAHTEGREATRIPPRDAGVLHPEPDPGPSRGEIVAVWGPIGSPGRTTVAVTLAAELAAGGLRTLLIDADTYGAAVAQVLGLLDDTPGLAAAARAAEQGTLDAPGLLRRAPEVTPRLRVLTGLPRADRWPEVRDAAMTTVLEVARLIADVVVVDCGFCVEADEELSYDTVAPRRNATTLTTLEAADRLLVVGAGDPVGLQRLVRALSDLGHVPSPPPRVVVNRVRESAAGPRPAAAIREVLGRFSGVDEVTVLPDDREACDAAMLAGRSLVEHAPGSRIRLAIGELARQILPGRLAAPSGSRRLRGRRRA